MESSGDDRDEEEGVVHWQGSQTSSVLDSLLRSGKTGKGKASRPKSGTTGGMSFSRDLVISLIYPR